MGKDPKTKHEFELENEELKHRLSECEDTLEAIRTGAVDALVVSDAQGEKIFSLQSVDYSYRVMAENMNEGAVTLDRNGVIVFSNRAFADLVGREMSSIVGAPFCDFLSDSSRNGFSSFLTESIVRPRREEFTIVRTHGATITVSISGTMFKVNGIENVCLIIHDLTEREIAERKLRNAYEEVEQKVLERTAELRESEERFRLLVEGIHDYAIFMLDTEGRVVTWNAGARRLKGYSSEEIIGKNFSCFYPPENSEAPKRELSIAVKEGFFTDESIRVRKDGSRFFASVTISALLKENGDLRGFVKITRDITERKRAEEELRAANEELREFNQIMVGRELRMIELKKEINDLCAKNGAPPRYEIEPEEDQP
jgi:PAS domain S-box-containing protein